MISSVPEHMGEWKTKVWLNTEKQIQDLHFPRKTTVLITQGLKDLFPHGPRFQQIN